MFLVLGAIQQSPVDWTLSLISPCFCFPMLGHKFLHINVYTESLERHCVENRSELKLIHDVDKCCISFHGQFLRPRTVPQASEKHVLSLGPKLFPSITKLDIAPPEIRVGLACRAVERPLKCRLRRVHVSSLQLVLNCEYAAADAVVGVRECNFAKDITDRVINAERG